MIRRLDRFRECEQLVSAFWSGPAVLDDLEAIAVLVAESEHRWHAFPAQDLIRVDAVGSQRTMVGVHVAADQPGYLCLHACWYGII